MSWLQVLLAMPMLVVVIVAAIVPARWDVCGAPLISSSLAAG
jgi:hypothetical protein